MLQFQLILSFLDQIELIGFDIAKGLPLPTGPGYLGLGLYHGDLLDQGIVAPIILKR